jgi:hypothetical protein
MSFVNAQIAKFSAKFATSCVALSLTEKRAASTAVDQEVDVEHLQTPTYCGRLAVRLQCHKIHRRI